MSTPRPPKGRTPGVATTNYIAERVVQAMVAGKGATKGVTVETATAAASRVMELQGRNLQHLVPHVLQGIATDPDAPAEAKALAGDLTSGALGFLGGVIQAIVGTAVGFGASIIFTPMFQGEVNKLWRHYPTLPLPATTAAELLQRGWWTRDDATVEASDTGVNAVRFQGLVDLSRAFPDLGSILALMDRGLVDAAEARGWLAHQGYDEHEARMLLALGVNLLAPADAALALLRGNMAEADARAEAAAQGINRERFDVLVGNTGEPPAIEELLFAYRRGIIDRDRLERGIRQSRMRNEWIDVVEALRFAPPSPAQAIAAAVQGHLPQAEARKLAAEGGLDPQWFDVMFQTAGRPISVTQAQELANRGVIDRTTFNQVVAEGDTKTKYTDALWAARVHLPPERSVVSMVSKGVLTKERGLALLMDLGFERDIAQALIDEAAAERTSKHKDLSVSLIEGAYLDRDITREQATARLVALGYDRGDAGIMLDLQDHARDRRYREAVISRVHASYVAGKLTPRQAQDILTADRIAAATQVDLLNLWDIERQAVVIAPPRAVNPELTVAQDTRLLHLGHIDSTEFVARMGRKGYDPREASELLILAQPEAQQRQLSVSEVQTLLRRGMLTVEKFRTTLKAEGFTEADTAFLAALAFPPGAEVPAGIPPTPGPGRELPFAADVTLYRRGDIDAAELTRRIEARGYTSVQAADLIRAAGVELPSAADAALLRRGTIDETEFLARMGRLGYTPAQASELLVLATPTPAHRTLTTAEVQALLRRGAVNVTEFNRRMAAAGYDAADTAFLAVLAFPPTTTPGS